MQWWQLSVASTSLAETIVVVIDQHKRVLAAEGGYRGGAVTRTKTPNSSPMVRRSTSEPADVKAADFASGGEASGDVDAVATDHGQGSSHGAADSDVEDANLATVGEEGEGHINEEEEGEDDQVEDDPSTYMALSESARGSLYDDSIDVESSEASWEIPIKNLRITQVDVLPSHMIV